MTFFSTKTDPYFTPQQTNKWVAQFSAYLGMRLVQAIILGLIVLLGVLLTLYITNYAKSQAKAHFLDQAIALSAGINPNDVAQLEGLATDKQLVAFTNVTNRMQTAKATLTGIRFVYMMRKINNKIIFISDSEPSTSADYSSYGEEYTEATPAFQKIFTDGKPFLEDSIQDRWGTWISVHAPIKQADGEILAVVGIDMDARKWHHEIFIYRVGALILTLLLLILFALSIFYFMAMTHWRQAEEKIRQKANEDHLTGLPNRMYIQNTIAQTIHRCKRHKRKFGILFIDLNNLKKINDELGHAAGDALLCEIAERLKHLLRASDSIGRLGGDEFVAIIDEIHNLQDATIVAKKIRDKCSEALALNELQGLTVSCSIGIAIYPDHGDTADSLLLHADAEMYVDKRNSQNAESI